MSRSVLSYVRSWPGAAALAMLLLALTMVPAQAEDGAFKRLKVYPSVLNQDTVIFSWSGRIEAPMASEIRAAFMQWRAYRSRIILRLNSGGGLVNEGERVISLLRRIRRSHTLDTYVGHGATCGSMCVPIYLQGHIRYGARTSTWLFHEVAIRERDTKALIELKRKRSRRLFEDHFGPAGVSRHWIDEVERMIVGTDFWQTGNDLLRSGSGVITLPLENQVHRIVRVPLPSIRGSATIGNPKPECREIRKGRFADRKLLGNLNGRRLPAQTRHGGDPSPPEVVPRRASANCSESR